MTLFQDVYEVFLRKIYDIDLANNLSLNLNVAENQMKGYLLSSIVRFDRCKQPLNYDEINEQFNATLNLTEKEILALFMIVEWLRPLVNNILNLKPFLNDKEFSGFSQANFLDKKISLLNNNEIDAYSLMNRYDENNNDYSNFN